MSKSNNLLTHLKQLANKFGAEFKFETANLEDGTTIEAEAFAAGEAVFVVAEDGNIPLPVGSYVLEDGRELVVEEEGVISSVGEVEAPEVEVEVEQPEVEVEAAEEEQAMTEDKVREIVAAYMEEMGYGKKEEMSSEEVVEEAKEEVAEPTIEPTPEVKVEASAQEAEVEVEEKIELSVDSAPAAKPIKANPERKAEQKFNFKIGANKRTESVRDRVFARIANS
jgi:hypothetical protein